MTGVGEYRLLQNQRIYNIYKLKHKRMQVATDSIDIILLNLSKPCHRQHLHQIIKYLSIEDITNISSQLQKYKISNPFSQLLKTYNFIYNYLNKVDRSFYYSFYDQPIFKQIQNLQIMLIMENYCTFYELFLYQYKQCFNLLNSLFNHLEDTQGFVQEVERMMVDTDVPMPKLKRENQGIYCRSVFQNFLVGLKYKNSVSALDGNPVTQPVCEYIQLNQQKTLQSLFMPCRKSRPLSKTIRTVRFTPYQLSYQNYKSYLLQHNSHHNLIVMLYTITDIYLQATKIYLLAIEDPFHCFVQFITRYNIFRNFVIEVEESLGAVWKVYGDLYQETFYGVAAKPRFGFWRGAYTKWLLKFQQFHTQLNSVFYYTLTKLRTTNLLSTLSTLLPSNPQKYTSITNMASLQQYKLQLKQTLFPNYSASKVQQYFEEDGTLYNTVLIQWIEYMVDISVNEECVHWCGFSQHQMGEPWRKWEQYVMAEDGGYLGYIGECVARAEGIDEQEKGELLAEILNNQLQFLASLQYKPTTLKKLLHRYNTHLSSTNPQTTPLTLDFQPADQTLKHFNQKQNIKHIIPQEQLFFYSITPLLSPDQLLTKSISTMCSQGTMMEEGEGEEDGDEGEESLCEMEYFSRSSDVEEYEGGDGEAGEGGLVRGTSCMEGVMVRKISKDSVRSPKYQKHHTSQTVQKFYKSTQPNLSQKKQSQPKQIPFPSLSEQINISKYTNIEQQYKMQEQKAQGHNKQTQTMQGQKIQNWNNNTTLDTTVSESTVIVSEMDNKFVMEFSLVHSYAQNGAYWHGGEHGKAGQGTQQVDINDNVNSFVNVVGNNPF